MRAAAVVLTYGRAACCELLGMIARQTQPLPVLLWLDDAPSVAVDPAAAVHVVQGTRFSESHSIGPVRAASIEAARLLFHLRPDDGILILDDDEFYAPWHFALTCAALERGAWTGARRLGLQLAPDHMPPELLESDAGPGQQGTWAFRLAHYDQAGGYRDEPLEDHALGYRMGWDTCRPHDHVSFVRRQYGPTMSSDAVRFDRAKLRAESTLTRHLTPRYPEACKALERWCQAQARAGVSSPCP